MAKFVEQDEGNLSREQIREKAQDNLMYWMAVAFTAASDEGEDPKVVKEMYKQFRRVERFFGYAPGSWRGV